MLDWLKFKKMAREWYQYYGYDIFVDEGMIALILLELKNVNRGKKKGFVEWIDGFKPMKPDIKEI